MRSHYCGGINESHIDQEVTLCGWVHRRRDHGGVIFLDLRDRDGMSQVVVDPDTPESFALAEKVRSEFVVKVTGRVRRRPAGTENSNMPTGQVELLGKEVTILNAAATPPFPLDEHVDVGEDVRLRYRFIDLRRPEMINRLRFRSRVTSYIRNFLDSRGFMDVETPILTRATPEGARDYLVPSRTHEGSFFALPQSPQLFKQMLMVSGVDRYYQIAKCFRDEDLRADRQPEFTQVDIEASFIDEETLMKLNEDMIRALFKDVLDVELPEFPRMPYSEAMQRYGSDKPDLRIPLELQDVNDLVEGVDFKVFAGPAKDPKGRVAALRVPKGGALTRKQIDDYTKFVGIYGAKGLAYIKVNELAKGVEGLQSPIIKLWVTTWPWRSWSALQQKMATSCSLVLTRPPWSTKPWAHCASKSVTTSTCSPVSGRRCGWWTSRCLRSCQTAASPLFTIRSLRRPAARTSWRPIRPMRCPALTTWC